MKRAGSFKHARRSQREPPNVNTARCILEPYGLHKESKTGKAEQRRCVDGQCAYQTHSAEDVRIAISRLSAQQRKLSRLGSSRATTVPNLLYAASSLRNPEKTHLKPDGVTFS